MHWTWTIGLLAASCASLHAAVEVSPAAVVLDNREATQQLLVTARRPDGRPGDVTRDATYEVLDPRILAVDAAGLVRPRAEGETAVLVRHGAATVRVPVAVVGFDQPEPVSFSHQIIPVL